MFKNDGNQFYDLKCEGLVLYSTFEPCEMCKGAMVHYNIKNILFEQNKTAYMQLKSMLKSYVYNLNIKRIDSANLQEKLFLEHPTYKK